MSRLNIRKRRKPGSIEDATLIQWRALSAAQEALYAAGEDEDVDGVLRACHAITQAASAYGRLLETGERIRRAEGGVDGKVITAINFQLGPDPDEIEDDDDEPWGAYQPPSLNGS